MFKFIYIKYKYLFIFITALWEAGLLSVTVNKSLSKNTPYLAHLDKSPCLYNKLYL